MPEAIVLAAGLLVAGVAVLAPLRRSPATVPDDDSEAAHLRHRVALEALRDVEADRRAGALDDDAYAAALADAEAHAAATRAALDAPLPRPATRFSGSATRLAWIAAAVTAGGLLIGAALPASGVANRTEVNQGLADAQEAEAARQARIGDLLAALEADPSDTGTLSSLADAYLEGSSEEDLVRAAVALRVLVELDPERADAYERIVAAYLRAGDHANARAALDAYGETESADPVEVAFLDGLIALRGEQDAKGAVAAFDRFLELAPDDPRAGMVRELRDEAEAGG